jgi:photosystem II stability/assembly factor-like uncharacterized protein
MRFTHCFILLCVWLASAMAPLSHAQTWVHIGLGGKTVNSIVVDPTDSNVILAGAEDGLYKTTDGGSTWNAVEPGLLSNIKDLSLYTYTPQEVYLVRSAGDPADGIYKSTDAGDSWNRVLELAYGTSLMDHMPLYAGALSDSGGGGGVYGSYDGGTTWDTLNEGLTNLDVLSLGVIACFDDSLDVYLAGTKGGIFRRTDSIWTSVGPAVNAFISDFGGGGLQCGAYAAWGNGSWSDGFYADSAMGESWTVKYFYVYARTVTTNPLNSRCVYGGALGGGVFGSTDWGETWEEMNDGLTDLDVIELAFSETDTTWLYAGTEGGGVFRFGLTPGIEEEGGRMGRISQLRLYANHPNPFRGSTKISYFLPKPSSVTLDIYDVTGSLIETLVDETQKPGIHETCWNGKGHFGGLYFCRLKACPERSPESTEGPSGEPIESRSRRAGEFSHTRKMVLID